MSDDAGFVVTDAMYALNSRLAFILPLAGAAMNLVVLLLIAALYCFRRARAHLDRVSFRLVIAVLIGNLIYGVCDTLAGKVTSVSHNQQCANALFLLFFGLQFSSFMTCCIAVNLELVLNHGRNGHKLEKWYYLGGTIFGLGLSVPAFALKAFSFDPNFGSCWWNPTDENTFAGWQMGGEVAWSLLLALIEFGLFISITVSLLRSKANFRNAPKAARGAAVQHYRTIIIRIGLYPVAGLALNTMTGFADIYLVNTTEVTSQTIWNIQLLSTAVYSFRPCVYPLLAIFDPSLVRAVKSLLYPAREGTTTNYATFSEISQRNTPQIMNLPPPGMQGGSEKDLSDMLTEDLPRSGLPTTTTPTLKVAYPDDNQASTMFPRRSDETVQTMELRVLVSGCGGGSSVGGDVESQLTQREIRKEEKELGRQL